MSPDVANGTLYLVDAYSLIFQVFHAIPGMTSPSGLPTNALFGFTRDLLFLRTHKKPEHLLCVLDHPGPTFRDEIYPEYKANRAPMPPDLQAQIPLIQQLLGAMRVPVLSVAGVEADDVIATVATAAAERGLDVFICTNDKDCRQLLNPRVRMFNLRKQAVFDRDALQADWGIRAEQVVDLQSLVGDAVDNVPGVPGIGVKTAAKLLQDFGTLDNLLANIERIPGAKKQENLRASAEIIHRSRQLVRLKTDVPLLMDWESWRLHEWDAPRLLALFRDWGFRGFGEQVRKCSVVSGPLPIAGAEGKAAPVQGELFPFDSNEPEEEITQRPATDNGLRTTDHLYHLVNTPRKLEDFLQQLRQQRRVAVDLETTGLDPLRSEIVGVAMSWKPGEAWYLPLRGPEGEAVLEPAATLAQLATVLEDVRVAKVNQNIKYDMLAFRHQGVALRGIAGDSMLADYLLHAGQRSHNIADLASRYLNHQVIPITDLIGKRGKAQLRMDQVATARVAEYSGEDADLAWQLSKLLETQLAEIGLGKLYDDVEVPLIEVLAELEFNGIRLDLPFLARLSEEMSRQLAGIEQDIYALAGHEFNIASPKQLRQVLFEELKLPTQRRTGITGEASTAQETLDRLAALGHALPRKILEHRQIAKLKGTYVDALPGLVNPTTGRVHASFNQTVAATGRLSSSDPNLQNIPVRTELGRQIRQAFLPEEGWQLLTADYSQIELRLLAHFCGDAELHRAFVEDRDIHASVAAQIFAVPEEEVTGDMRRLAKTVNFGVIYGMSAHGLADRLGISREDAAKFIDAYFARYPLVLEHQGKLLENCRRQGYVSTILGRRRTIEGIRSPFVKGGNDGTPPLPMGGTGGVQRNQPEREAINMEIQGSAADLLKLAMLNIHRRLQGRYRSRMLLTVHDELVFEVPPDELDEVTNLVRKEMITAMPLEVPLRVDVGVGPNWLDVEEVVHTTTV